MKTIITLLSLLLFYFSTCNSQGISNIWMGGYGNWVGAPPYGGWKMDFFSGPPVITYENRAIDFDYTGSTITDSIGNFLFTTNGIIILNNVNDTMINGTGINPSQYTTWFSNNGLRMWQPNIILPDLNFNNQYYLFHMTLDTLGNNAHAFYFYYSIVDMNLNGGTGEVVLKNQILFTGNITALGLNACKHANGRDWWILAREFNGSNIYYFLLTPSGPTFSHSQSIGFRIGSGQTSFSPDGSRFGSYSTDDDFEIFDFDRCSGLLSNNRTISINDSMVSVGAAFSPNSRFLYGSSSNYLYQIDASSNQPDTTLITVAIWDGYNCPNPPFATRFFMQQLGPDGKIYISTGSSTCNMHTIEYPDSSGLSSNVQQHSVVLPTYNTGTIPNHPNYFLGPLIGSGCDTLTSINNYFDRTPLTLSAYPNPLISSELEINYSLQQNQLGDLEIINNTGQSVYRNIVPQWSSYQKINLPHIPQGLYLLTLRSGSKFTTLKFIKN